MNQSIPVKVLVDSGTFGNFVFKLLGKCLVHHHTPEVNLCISCLHYQDKLVPLSISARPPLRALPPKAQSKYQRNTRHSRMYSVRLQLHIFHHIGNGTALSIFCLGPNYLRGMSTRSQSQSELPWRSTFKRHYNRGSSVLSPHLQHPVSSLWGRRMGITSLHRLSCSQIPNC